MEMMELSPLHDHASLSVNSNTSGRNVFTLLARREISPRTKHVPKWHWGESSKSKSGSCSHPKSEALIDAKRGLLSWVEAESLRHLSAKYCSLAPPPRSTIAAAFSPDGNVLASTHGDHTVKIIDSETGNCLKVLAGHRRTPWVVRFHPLQQNLLASGSLDQEVCLWDADASDWILSHYFYRPIASIAFHANGEIIAVATGHKLYMWQYNNEGEASLPVFVLKTRRSLRAVHFHPHAAPYLLTAQVNDLDSSDSKMTQATCLGYLQYPPPVVFITNVHPRTPINLSSELPYMPLSLFFVPPYTVDESRVELQHASHGVGSSNMQVESSAQVQSQADTNATEQYEIPTSSQTVTEPAEGSQLENDANISSRHAANHVDLSDQFRKFFPSADPSGWELPFLQGWLMGQSQVGDPSMLPHIDGNHESHPRQTAFATRASDPSTTNDDGSHESHPRQTAFSTRASNPSTTNDDGSLESHPRQTAFATRASDPSTTNDDGSLESHPRQTAFATRASDPSTTNDVGGHESHPRQTAFSTRASNPSTTNDDGGHESHPRQTAFATRASDPSTTNDEVAMSSSQMPGRINMSAASVQSGLPNQLSQSLPVSDSGNRAASINSPRVGSDSQTIMNRIKSELATSLATAAAADLPCTVKLKIWSHDLKNPCGQLNRCRLTIPHVVLCSEMGAHFSPCGRFLAACVACMLPNIEGDPGLQTMVHQEPEVATSPTRHPISAHQVMYELRIYSLEEAKFGLVLASRAIRAAHCLTSIQFSPSSEHILVAYGRRHSSLLRSVVIDGETTLSIYTVLEVYRVSDMELVRVLPSAEDEVNVACFHPSPGGGLVYGTKEGKLRIFQFDRTQTVNGIGSSYFPEDNIIRVSQ